MFFNLILLLVVVLCLACNGTGDKDVTEPDGDDDDDNTELEIDEEMNPGEEDVEELDTTDFDIEEDVPYTGEPGPVREWAQVDVCGGHSCAVTTGGELWCWDSKASGMIGSEIVLDNFRQLGTDRVWKTVKVYDSTCAIEASGPLWCLDPSGDSSLQLIGTESDRWLDVATGVWHTCGIKANPSISEPVAGQIWCWGDNYYSQLGFETPEPRNNPPGQVGIDEDWVSVTAGAEHTCGRKADGRIFCWGYNRSGQLGIWNEAFQDKPVRTGSENIWKVASSGEWRTCGINTENQLWCWGYKDIPDCSPGRTDNCDPPQQIGSDSDWMAVTESSTHTCAIRAGGQLWCWGDNTWGQLGLDSPDDFKEVPRRVGTDSDWTSVVASNDFTCGIKAGGQLWCWGGNWYGVLGSGNTDNTDEPVRVGNDSDWTNLTVGRRHTCALKAGGELWCWGSNQSGQLGHENLEGNYYTPTRVGADSDWNYVAAGSRFTCAVKAAGELWCWGLNEFGQLGLGDTQQYSSPQRVGTESDWASATSGKEHVCAIKTDNSLWCWGNNQYGRLGIGGEDGPHLTPQRVGMDLDWISVSAGYLHNCALKADGSFWCWGNNWYNQLGQNVYRHVTPQQVGVDSDWIQVEAGEGFTCAVKADGQLWWWGVGNWFPERPWPESLWKTISAAGSSILGITPDSELWKAYNNEGEVKSHKKSAWEFWVLERVGEDSDWASAAIVDSYSCAIKTNNQLWCWKK